MTLQQNFRRLSEIGIQITALSEESKIIRAEISLKCPAQKSTFIDGTRVWTVEPSKDGKDWNITYCDAERLDVENAD